MHKIFNNHNQIELRRNLRQQPVSCERLLWNKIRNRQLGKFKFKRQFSIGPFIVDFYCPEARLVIEIDGATHSSCEELEYDKKRQAFLENQGVIVKRYRNIDIKENLLSVLEKIMEACLARSV